MRTGYLITARLKSSRLKRKILLDIDGDTVLDKVIKRCKEVKGIDTIILCTSINPEDKELKKVAEKHSIEHYRGEEKDVLRRLLFAARNYDIDRFLSITADNPLHSIEVANEILNFDNHNNFDSVFTTNLAIGLSPYFLRTDALEVASYMKADIDTEIWGPYINQPSFFNVGYINYQGYQLFKDLRITCDYEQDYQLIKNIYTSIPNDYPDLDLLYSLLIKSPQTFNINKDLKQIMPSNDTLTKISQQFNSMINSGIVYARERGFIINPGITEIKK